MVAATGSASSSAAARLTRARMLIAGDAGSGQPELGGALLHALEWLPVVAIDMPSLLAETSAASLEEALVRRVATARRSAPCVLYMPGADEWWLHASESLRSCLLMLVQRLPTELPMLLLATASTAPDGLPSDLMVRGERCVCAVLM